MLYFDHNATTPLLPVARDAWVAGADQWPGNPSSPHRMGSRASNALDEARGRLAAILGCDALDLVWTSGATESNNQVFHHFSNLIGWKGEIWVSAIEHPSVLAAVRHYFPGRYQLIPIRPDGTADLSTLFESAGKALPGLVVLMAANNETGVVQPWGEALGWCRERGVPFFCDASQWLGKLPASGLGAADFVSGCAHKFGGPRGIGFLKCPGKGRVAPLIHGGPQEEGRRAGTENVAGALALVAALEHRTCLMTPEAVATRKAWRDRFEDSLLGRLPGSVVVGGASERLWNTSSVLMPVAECQQRWVVKIDRHGCAVSTGSACSSGKEEPSHVLGAMGYSPTDASRMLRFSSGWETAEEDWSRLGDALCAAQASLQGP